MKKVLSFLVAGALALGLIGCSGDMHNDVDPATIPASIALAGAPRLSAGGVAGAMQGWSVDTITWTTKDDDNCKYTYDFVANAEEIEWKVVSKKGNWNSGAYGGGADTVTDANVGKTVTLTYDNATGGNKNVKTSGLKVNKVYTITLEYNKGNYDCTVTASDKEKPVPFYLNDAYFFLGDYNNWDEHNVANMFTQYSLDEQSGDVIYKVVVEATQDGTQFGIPALTGIETWATAYKNAEVTVDGGWTKLTKYVDGKDADDKTGNNATVKGMTAGSKYNVYLKTTEKKEVFVKIDVVPAFNYIAGIAVVGLDATNFADGTKVLFNGDYLGWGAWDDTNKNTPVVSNGVAAAKFAEAIKIEKNKDASKNEGKTIIELCNAGLNAEGKPDWDNKRLCTKYNEDAGNFKLELTEAELDGGNYMIFADLTGVAAGDAISWKLVKVNTTDVMFVAGATGLPAEANGKVVYMTGNYTSWAKPGENNYTAAVKIADGKVFSVGFCAADEIQFKFAGKDWTVPEVGINQADNNDIVVTITEEKHTVIGKYASTVAAGKYGCNWEVK